MPLMFLREWTVLTSFAMNLTDRLLAISLSAIADAANAIERLYDVFEAETLDETQVHEPGLKAAIEVEGASFTWDSPPPQIEDSKKRKRFQSKKKFAASNPTKATDDNTPFKIREVDLSIPRGQLIAIVGPVGTGKTSLLQGLIGEMRRTSGSVTFGGTLSYCPQTAWIQVRTISSACS